LQGLYEYLSNEHIICLGHDKGHGKKCKKLYTKKKEIRKGKEGQCLGICKECLTDKYQIKRREKRAIKQQQQITTKKKQREKKNRQKRNKRYYTKKREVEDAKNIHLSENQTDQLEQVHYYFELYYIILYLKQFQDFI
jgi:hypothetical protein